MTTYLVDTNVISYYVARDAERRQPRLVERVRELEAGEGVVVSIMTMYELFAGLRKLELQLMQTQKTTRVHLYLQTMRILRLESMWGVGANLAARASVEGLALGTADTLITATALASNRVLATADARLVANLAKLDLSDHVELWPCE